jgi:hypothetical protein
LGKRNGNSVWNCYFFFSNFLTLTPSSAWNRCSFFPKNSICGIAAFSFPSTNFFF